MRTTRFDRFTALLLPIEQPSFAFRGVIAALMAITGFGLTYVLYSTTRFYFTSLTIISGICIALFCGFSLCIFFSSLLAIAADYFFIPPIGSVLDSAGGYEHLLIVVGLATLVAALGSLIRSAFGDAVSARQSAERAMEEAERAKAEVEQTSRTMETVLALVSHDIRNPLNTISIGCQLLLDTPGQSEVYHSTAQSMMRSLDQINAMIESLLDVARIRSGKGLRLERQICDLTVEVGQTVDEMSLLGSDRLVFIASDSLPGAWGIIGIRRALQNLITNAMKYGRADAPITVRLWRNDDRAFLSVHNQGKGIPAEEQQTLFEAFRRTQTSEAGPVRGWGLGLALVKGIAEAHGGSVSVESADAVGTTFTMELPIIPPEH
jgi:signal transduction histidine kinase